MVSGERIVHLNKQEHLLSAPGPGSSELDVNAENMDWYLVYTKPRLEQQAFSNLEQQGYRCYLPKFSIERIRFRRLVEVVEPMFPRYLFIQLGNELKGKSWAPIRSTPGVSHLVSFGNLPAKIAPQLIELLRQNEIVTPARNLFYPGEAVSAIDGPFAGIHALYQTLDADRRAIILLEILGKLVSVKIDGARLRKIG